MCFVGVNAFMKGVMESGVGGHYEEGVTIIALIC